MHHRQFSSAIESYALNAPVCFKESFFLFPSLFFFNDIHELLVFSLIPAGDSFQFGELVQISDRRAKLTTAAAAQANIG